MFPFFREGRVIMSFYKIDVAINYGFSFFFDSRE
jgi:hypothetical protein